MRKRALLLATCAPLFAWPLLACHGATSSASPESASTTTGASQAASQTHVGTDPGHVNEGMQLTPTGNDQLAAFAAGCFWGVEDAFRHVPGVVATAVGYAGGHTEHPSYEDVCTHTTGHAETVLVEFDPQKVTYDKLLRVFFTIHDPTQVNRQGPDVGSNYRSVIFFFSPDQQKAAEAAKQAKAKEEDAPIATQVVPIAPFWKAESYHQQYSERTGDHSCPINSKLPTL